MKQKEYRGKYTKCRTCRHVEEIMNMLVVTKSSCPNKVPIAGHSTKSRCQRCDKWECKNDEEKQT